MTPSQIRSLRKSLNLSKTEFALALGFTGNRTLVYRWEEGIRKPSKQTIILMKQLRAKDRIEEIHEETGLSRSKVVERKVLDLPIQTTGGKNAKMV